MASAQEIVLGIEPWVAIILVIIGILIIAIIYQIIQIIRARNEGPTHVEEYFSGNFRTMIGEWDLVTRPRLKQWKSSMTDRLSIITSDITSIESTRKGINGRLDTVEKDLNKLEGL